MNPIIKLSDNAANRIKEIMFSAEKDSLWVRVSVKSGGCAGMSYVMEYSKEVKEGAMQVEEIDDVDLQLVWDPPWTKDMMSDAAKLELNL